MVPQWVALHKNVSAEVRLDGELMKRRGNVCVCVCVLGCGVISDI